jgi:succinate-acetate transporter protein
MQALVGTSLNFRRRGKVVADDSLPAFLLVFMGIFSLVCFLGALKVHIALAVVELSLTMVFALLAGAFWEVAAGNASVASNLQTVSIMALDLIH